MATKRGHIGMRGSEFVIQFSKPGYDVDTAPAEGLVFNSGAKRLRPLVSGIMPNCPVGNTNVQLPKTFIGLPLIFVDRLIGSDATASPWRGFEVTYFRGRDYFTINNQSGGPASFSFNVYDNEIT
jgi:hypothetical protein